MTDFLRVNGITAKILVPDAGMDVEEVGDKDVAVDGSELSSRRTLKMVFNVKLGLYIPRTALAWRRLLMGEGHSFNFDSNLYSSKGLPPTSIGAGVAQTGASSKFGAGCMSMPATRTITYTALSGATFYSIAYWAKVGAAAWNHHVRNSGSFWLNGVATGVDPGFASASGTIVTMTADGGSTTLIDDLVILPFSVPTDWPAQMYAWGTTYASPFSDLPKLTIDGLLNDDGIGTRSVIGSDVKTKPQQGVISGVRYPNVTTVEAMLREF